MPKEYAILKSKDAQAKIASAVAEAEQLSGGEIVPYIVERSDHYEEATWRGAVTVGITALVAGTAYWAFFLPTWSGWEMPEIILGSLMLGIVAGWLVNKIPALERFFAGKHLMEFRVSRRAAQSFLAEEVFATRDRTGVLIFVSLLEHRVLVLGDTGITKKVKQEEWDNIVGAIVKGMKTGAVTEGMVEGIGLTGDLLQKAGVERRSDDRDELSNAPRMGGGL